MHHPPAILGKMRVSARIYQIREISGRAVTVLSEVQLGPLV